MAALAILAALGLAVLAFLLLRKGSVEPSGWSAGPIYGGVDYSAGVVVGTDGSFAFPTAAPGVHYVTRATGPLSPNSLLRLRYRIDAPNGAAFCPVSEPAAPSIGPTLYFQRAGDDWSGQGEYETFRWWATFNAPSPIKHGVYELVSPLNAHWTAVETSNASDQAAAFEAALANAARVGFTFGGGTGYGHGVYATEAATFTLLSLTVEPNP